MENITYRRIFQWNGTIIKMTDPIFSSPWYLVNVRNGKYTWHRDYSHAKPFCSKTARKHVHDLEAGADTEWIEYRKQWEPYKQPLQDVATCDTIPIRSAATSGETEEPTMETTYNKNKRAYNMQYEKENMKQVKFNFSLKYDADILTWLDSLPNKQGYIKELIRTDMASRAKSDPNQVNHIVE